ncbi:hypothetical protein As57867_005118, partial [Aphanomyces stellatus]
FNLDGLDIDDETRGAAQYDAARVLAMATALAAPLHARGKVLSLDAFLYDVDPVKCVAVVGRCLPRGIESIVDWVNVMAYNVAEDASAAAAVYATATTTLFSQWAARLASPAKMVVGVCTESSNPLYRGCAYGPGPSPDVVSSWVKWSATNAGGGMSIWAASKDQFLNYTLTKMLVVQ